MAQPGMLSGHLHTRLNMFNIFFTWHVKRTLITPLITQLIVIILQNPVRFQHVHSFGYIRVRTHSGHITRKSNNTRSQSAVMQTDSCGGLATKTWDPQRKVSRWGNKYFRFPPPFWVGRSNCGWGRLFCRCLIPILLSEFKRTWTIKSAR